MGSWLEALVAAVVQGVTEFLPVSSSGHLRVLGHLFGLDEPATAFDVTLHLATLLSVLFVFRGDIRRILTGRSASEDSAGLPGFSRLVLIVVAGTIPAAFLGVFAGDAMESFSADIRVVGAAYLLNTGILILAHRTSRRHPDRPMHQMTVLMALAIGLAQALAITRGISRSGTTITAALLLGFSPDAAALFSFLLAIPVIAGAAALKAPDLLASPEVAAAPGQLLAAFVAAFVTGVAALRLLLHTVRKAVWLPYAGYCLALALLCGLVL